MFKWKVLQKAVEAKDFRYLAPILFQELVKQGWSDDHIAQFAKRLLEQKR